MNNNEILVRKAIEDKEREANSYEDQGCYNAAYCYGYAAGASDALSSLKQPDPKELYKQKSSPLKGTLFFLLSFNLLLLEFIFYRGKIDSLRRIYLRGRYK